MIFVSIVKGGKKVVDNYVKGTNKIDYEILGFATLNIGNILIILCKYGIINMYSDTQKIEEVIL